MPDYYKLWMELRAEIERLHSERMNDAGEIEALRDEIERLQLALKLIIHLPDTAVGNARQIARDAIAALNEADDD